MAAPAAV